jgi:hypothetical protein
VEIDNAIAINRNSERGARFFTIGIIVLLSLLTLCVVSHASSFNRLWRDELFVIQVCMEESFSGGLKYIFFNEGNGALFDIVMWFWYRVAPYGDKYLLIVPNVFAALGVFVFAMLGRRLFGNSGGVISALVASAQNFLLLYANELRAYSLTFAVVSLLLYSYFGKFDKGKNANMKKQAIYGVCLALAVYTYYLSVLTCFVLFAADIFLHVKNKISGRFIIGYFIGGVLFLPGAYLLLQGGALGAGWAAPPSGLLDLKHVFWQLIDSVIYRFSFLTGCALVVVQLFRKKTERIENTSKPLILFALVISVTAVLYVSGRYFDSHWFVNRYFFIVYPAILMLVVFAALAIFDILCEIDRNRRHIPVAILIAVAIFSLSNAYATLMAYPDVNTWDIDLEGAADYLDSQPDSRSDHVGVLYLADYPVAWEKYCVEQKGKRQAIRLSTFEDINAAKYDKLYVLSYPETPSWLPYPEYLQDNYHISETIPSLPISVWIRNEGMEGQLK